MVVILLLVRLLEQEGKIMLYSISETESQHCLCDDKADEADTFAPRSVCVTVVRRYESNRCGVGCEWGDFFFGPRRRVYRYRPLAAVAAGLQGGIEHSWNRSSRVRLGSPSRKVTGGNYKGAHIDSSKASPYFGFEYVGEPCKPLEGLQCNAARTVLWWAVWMSTGMWFVSRRGAAGHPCTTTHNVQDWRPAGQHQRDPFQNWTLITPQKNESASSALRQATLSPGR
jgi:hypothetical protein